MNNFSQYFMVIMLVITCLCSIPVDGADPDVERDDRNKKIEQKKVKGDENSGGSNYHPPINSPIGQVSLKRKNNQKNQKESDDNPQVVGSDKQKDPVRRERVSKGKDDSQSSPLDRIGKPINSQNNYQSSSSQNGSRKSKLGQVSKRKKTPQDIKINQSDIKKYKQQSESRRNRRSGMRTGDQNRKLDGKLSTKQRRDNSDRDLKRLDANQNPDNQSMRRQKGPGIGQNMKGARDGDVNSKLNSREKRSDLGQSLRKDLNRNEMRRQNREAKETLQRETLRPSQRDLKDHQYEKVRLEREHHHPIRQDIERQRRELDQENLDPIHRREIEDHIRELENQLEAERRQTRRKP